MQSSILIKWRSVLCLASILSLSACASGGVKPVQTLTKSESGGQSASLYANQTPPVVVDESTLAQLEAQVASSPRDPSAYLKLGVAYRHVDNFDEAMRVFEQALALSETPYAARNEMGILLRAQGDFKEAEAVYQQILSEAPDFHDAHFNLGILYDLYLRRPLDAHTHYQAYMNNAPQADERVEKWLVDLQRRHQIGASASAGVVGE